MKKALSLLLVLVLALSLSTVAFAEGPSVTGTVDLAKLYKLAAEPQTGVATNPAETFTFTIAKEKVENSPYTIDNMPMFTAATASISFTADEVTAMAGDTNTTSLQLPTYDRVGDYWYKITEVVPVTKTAGVTYDETPVFLHVSVRQGTNGLELATQFHRGSVESSNKTGFENTYTAGSLEVSKTVTGALGDRGKDFAVKVTFNAPNGEVISGPITYIDDGVTKTLTGGAAVTSLEASITLKHGEQVVFNNIPEGVTYTVEETTPADYTASYNPDDANQKIDGTEKDTVAITNNKDGIADTGVSLDSLPYILLLVAAAAGLVLFLGKKRFAGEN